MFTKRSETTQVAIFGSLTILLPFATYWLPLPRDVLPFLMVLLPALLAIVLTTLSDGQQGVRLLLGKLGEWRITPKWLVIALLLALVVRLAISVLALLLGLIPSLQVRPVSASQVLILALVFILSAIPEELGWRGYALPKLLTHYSALVASLLIGVAWGSLHLALLLPGMMNAGVPALPTVLAVACVSVLTTWLYVNTGGNLILVILFHAAQNFFTIVNEGIPFVPLAWLMLAVYLALALLVGILAGWNLKWLASGNQLINHPLHLRVDDTPPG